MGRRYLDTTTHQSRPLGSWGLRRRGRSLMSEFPMSGYCAVTCEQNALVMVTLPPPILRTPGLFEAALALAGALVGALVEAAASRLQRRSNLGRRSERVAGRSCGSDGSRGRGGRCVAGGSVNGQGRRGGQRVAKLRRVSSRENRRGGIGGHGSGAGLGITSESVAITWWGCQLDHAVQRQAQQLLTLASWPGPGQRT